ncbi:MAG TPA: phytanoyl-CoA dioxygenase family protein [Acidimicrobiia bacterium]|nr:phytanoyl-CoA dioxygenase family protein [Acidimicrobiia bacterium]
MSVAQRREFEERGYLVVRGALDAAMVDRLLAAHERVYEAERAAGRLTEQGVMHGFAFVVRDPVYLDLLDLPSTFPLVWSLLGWNIFMYHCHIDQHPGPDPHRPGSWDWHRDGGRQNFELDALQVAPRVSVKIGYFLSDLSVPGRGNLAVVPGSHRRRHLPRRRRPDDEWETPAGAIEVLVDPGDAVLFDRRLYHSRAHNHSHRTRRALFLAYTYRWVRARDDYPIDETSSWFRRLTPVRQQLLGAGTDAQSFWGLGNDRYPLYEWLRTRGLLTATRNMRPPDRAPSTESTDGAGQPDLAPRSGGHR